MTHFDHFVFLLQDLEEELPGAVMFVPGNPSAGVGPRQWRRLPGKPPQP